MKSNHNKKRNIGLVYELLLRSISSSLVEGNQEKANLSIDILKKRFAPGTEIYSEFRIFNAIMNTTVTDTSVAAGILTEAKNAIKKINYDTLHIEKSKLISEINKQIKDPDFFKRRVPNYKEFATVGTAINHWRQGDMSNLAKQVINEQRLIEFMLSEKNLNDKTFEEMTDSKADNLVVKIMTEKINKSYVNLNAEQKKILREYAVYGTSDAKSLEEFLIEMKSKSLNSLKDLKKKSDNKVLLSKIDFVVEKINNLSESNISDTDIAKYLKVSELKTQLGR